MNLEQVISQYRGHGMLGEVGGRTVLRNIRANQVLGGLELRSMPSRLGKHRNRLEEIFSMASLRDGSSQEDMAKRTFLFTASDDTCDRYNSRLLVDGRIGTRSFGDGWQLGDFKRNSVFQWCHTYDTIPIGTVADVYVDSKGVVKRLMAAVVIGDGRANPMALEVAAAYADGLMKAVSVGFDALRIYYPQDIDESKELGLDQRNSWDLGYVVGEEDLWELSAVPVPGNANALIGKSVEQGEAKRWLAFSDRIQDYDAVHAYQIRAVVSGAAKGVSVMALLGNERGVVCCKSSSDLSSKDTWSKPTLGDFTDKSWDELSDTEKKAIGDCFAWAPADPPETFGDFKLPHHDPDTKKLNRAGLAAAAGRLGQADLPAEDLAKVKARLESHYHAIDEKAPWEEEDSEKAAFAMAREMRIARFGVTRGDDDTSGDGDEGAPTDPSDSFSVLAGHLHKARLACARVTGHVAGAHGHLDEAHTHLDNIGGSAAIQTKKSARKGEGDGEGVVNAADKNPTPSEEPGEFYDIGAGVSKARAALGNTRGKLANVQSEIGGIHRIIDKAHAFMDTYAGDGGTGKGNDGTGGSSASGASSDGSGSYTELSAKLADAIRAGSEAEVRRLSALLTLGRRGGTISPSPSGASGPVSDLTEVTQRLAATVGDLQRSLNALAKGGQAPKGSEPRRPSPKDITLYADILTVLDDTRKVVVEAKG
jgi:hypothetical protein